MAGLLANEDGAQTAAEEIEAVVSNVNPVHPVYVQFLSGFE